LNQAEIARMSEELNQQKSKTVTKQVTHNSHIADLEGKLAESVSFFFFFLFLFLFSSFSIVFLLLFGVLKLNFKYPVQHEELEKLRERLAACSDYDDIRKELEVMKVSAESSEAKNTQIVIICSCYVT